MVAADALWTATVQRDQLLEMLEGDGPDLQPIAPQELVRVAPRSGEIVAIWSSPSKSDRSPLPQILIGDQPTIEDLFAWAAAYLRGLGPLTAQTRVLTPDEFRTVLQREPASMWWVYAGGATGLVLAEALVLAGRATPLGELSLLACRSTLSFLLIRAAVLGCPQHELGRIADHWEEFRGRTGDVGLSLSVRTAAEVVTALILAKSDSNVARTDVSLPAQWLISLLNRDAAKVAREIASVFDGSPNAGIDQIIDKTAEERVKLFDSIAPLIIDDGRRGQSEKAFAIALLAFLCRPGFSQQATLLAPHSATMPEAALWLGAMQATVPVPKALAVGNGLGWRLARDLFRPEDVFSAPRCDVAASEHRVLMRGGSALKAIRSMARSYFKVELHPGVVTLVRSFQADSLIQPDLPIEHPSSGIDASYGTLFEVERHLEAALRSVRGARFGARDDRPRGRRKPR